MLNDELDLLSCHTNVIEVSWFHEVSRRLDSADFAEP